MLALALIEPIQSATAIPQQIPHLNLPQLLANPITLLYRFHRDLIGQIESIMLKPTLIIPDKVSTGIMRIYFDLILRQLLQKLIILMIPIHLDLLYVIKDPL